MSGILKYAQLFEYKGYKIVKVSSGWVIVDYLRRYFSKKKNWITIDKTNVNDIMTFDSPEWAIKILKNIIEIAESDYVYANLEGMNDEDLDKVINGEY